MNSNMLKVGLLGAGRIAGVHATAITTNPGSSLVAVSDINTDAAAKLAAQYRAEARTTDGILNDPTIDASPTGNVLLASLPIMISANV